MADRAYPVTREQQQEMGLRSSQQFPSNFVAPAPSHANVPATTHQQITFDVTHPATQHVELRTSAVDRAKGYQIMIAPISIVVAVLAVIVSLAFDNELFTFASLLIFWLTFAVIYAGGWILTALATPEAVSWYGAKRQWDVIEREQQERWEHYRWQTGRAKTLDARQTRLLPRSDKSFTVFVSSVELPSWVLLVAGLVGVGCAVLYLVG